MFQMPVFPEKNPVKLPTIDENWESRVMYQTILSQTSAGVGVLWLSLDGTIFRVNDCFCQLTGYTEKELVSLTLWQLSTPQDINEQLQVMQESLTRGQIMPAIRTRYQCKDDAYIWARLTEFLIPLPSGEPGYFVFFVDNITDQVRSETERAELLARIQDAEEHVRKSFGVLLALAEELVHIPGRLNQKPFAEQITTGQLSPALSLQAVGKYLADISCQMLGYQSVIIAFLDPGTELMRPVVASGLSPQIEALVYAQLSTFLLSEYLDLASLDLLRANEVIFWDFSCLDSDIQSHKLLAAPMILDGHLMGIVCVKKRGSRQEYTSEEISLVKAVAKLILLVIERERLQQEWIEAHSSELALREANRRFDEFLSIASHELRTPLAGIKGNIQLALRRLAKIKSSLSPEIEDFSSKLESVEDFLRHAEHRVNVQNRMIGDFLDVSRIQANKLELVMEPCDLLTIVSEAVEDQRYTVPGRVITLTLPNCTQVLVNGDADRIAQVIHNYLTNALKYSPPDQPVAVSLELEKLDARARVSVSDKGPGLTAEEQQHVWERFYQVKGIEAQSGFAVGLGLGLHISRIIVEAHHGSLGLESTPGEGSTFWFTLPFFAQYSI
jgi:PAS domain S-box-containing protein